MKAKYVDNDITYYGKITSLQGINDAKAHNTLVLLGLAERSISTLTAVTMSLNWMTSLSAPLMNKSGLWTMRMISAVSA